jgi:hypothetical protein
MQFRTLGPSGLKISVIGLGTWAIGGGDWKFGWGDQDEKSAIGAIVRAVELGVNWIDTAAIYGEGRSEILVARAIAAIPLASQPLIATKCGRVAMGNGEIVKPIKPGIAMFTTENTEFAERTEHNGRCNSTVCSVDSVVKSVTRLCHAPSTWKTNELRSMRLAISRRIDRALNFSALWIGCIWPSADRSMRNQSVPHGEHLHHASGTRTRSDRAINTADFTRVESHPARRTDAIQGSAIIQAAPKTANAHKIDAAPKIDAAHKTHRIDTPPSSS